MQSKSKKSHSTQKISTVSKVKKTAKPLVDFYVPVSFSSIPLGEDEKYRDDLAYIVHLLVMAPIFNNKYKRVGKTKGWVPLYSLYLQQVIRRSYKKVIEVGVKHGIIEQYTAYRFSTSEKPGFSRKYRISNKAYGLRSEKWKKYVPQNKRLIRNILKWKKEQQENYAHKYTGKVFQQNISDEQQQKNKKIHNHLFKWLNQIEIEDVDEEEITKLVRKKTKKNKTKAQKEQIEQIYRIMLEKIKDRDFFFSKDKYGRVHTNLTNLCKELRKNIYIQTIKNIKINKYNKYINKTTQYNNKQIQQIDISNSQPLFLTILIKTQLTNILNLVEFPEDLKNFENLCLTGELYNFIDGKIGKKIERGRLKVLCFGMFYGRNLYPSLVGKVFQEHFPTVWEFIRRWKQQYGYKALAQEMQRTESEFVIGRCCGRLMDEFPEIPLLTIHDSISTIKEHVYTIYRIMKEEFVKLLDGACPHLKIEDF